ncbi:MAG TPA: plastocyanin/azurin family copper-binding protein [Actinomycetes bacterium]|jgi:uncharacterized cupredoxin-like copper-binding protein|nr:plastocyanin/azurin family copper-binding protein [Actinomycetes bacterium]
MPQRPVPRRPPLLAAACAALLAACAAPGASAPSHQHSRSGHGQAGAASHEQHSPSHPQAPLPATRPAGSATVEVEMTDAFRFRPSRITVERGRTVTFLITNVGKLEHEFVIGNRAAQDEHELMMQQLDDTRMHDHLNAVSVLPGQTKRLTWRFPDRGTVLIGCHVIGHYAAGMKGSITVV